MIRQDLPCFKQNDSTQGKLHVFHDHYLFGRKNKGTVHVSKDLTIDPKHHSSTRNQKRRCLSLNQSKQCHFSISPFLQGLLLGGLVGALVLIIILSVWLIPINRTTTTTTMSTQRSITNTSTVSTTYMNATYGASTITITSNRCTSSWQRVTLIAHCDTCRNVYAYQQISYRYAAIATQTLLSFAFLKNSGYFGIDDVSVRNSAIPNTELLVNGGFESGNLSSWNYCFPIGASAGGSVQSTWNSIIFQNYTFAAHTGSYYYLGGATTYPDYLSQAFSTNIGDIYNITFSYVIADTGSLNSGDFLLSV